MMKTEILQGMSGVGFGSCYAKQLAWRRQTSPGTPAPTPSK